MRVMFLSLLSLGLGLGAWSCGPTHCGYNGGDAACAARDPNTPFCDLCLQDNDGCVASEPIDAACVLIGDSGSVDTLPPSTLPPPSDTTNVSDPTTMGPGSLSAETTDPTVVDPTTTTSPPQTVTSAPEDTTEVSTSSSESTSSTSTTSEDTTSGPGSTSTTSDDTSSSESTSTTSDETTGPPPPMCGNDVIEGSEVCDGSDLGGKKCTDFPGKGGGTLACNPMCSMFDQAACCLANGQACQNNGQCCNNSCKFDLLMAKNICK